MATKFTLEVEFSGLCLYVRRKNKSDGITVLLPDARFAHQNGATHPDGTDAVAHVPYLRINAANLPNDGSTLDPSITNGAPDYELVHRLDRESIDFGVAAAGAVKETSFLVPEFGEVAPVLRVKDSVLKDTNPPQEVVARTQLTGGTIQAVGIATQQWKFTGELRPDRQDVGPKTYGGVVTWSREIEDSGLTLKLSSLDGKTTQTIPLVPRKDASGQLKIQLKIANLCATNPLEWDELPENTVLRDDVDFKWLYTLLEVRPADKSKVEDPNAVPCPSPVKSVNEGMLQDCFSGAITEG